QPAMGSRQPLDTFPEALRMLDERGDVAEDDPRFGIVGNGADQSLEVGGHGVPLRAWQTRRLEHIPTVTKSAYSTRPATASSRASRSGSRLSGAVMIAPSSARRAGSSTASRGKRRATSATSAWAWA